jgi:hypothetical protein
MTASTNWDRFSTYDSSKGSGSAVRGTNNSAVSIRSPVLRWDWAAFDHPRAVAESYNGQSSGPRGQPTGLVAAQLPGADEIRAVEGGSSARVSGPTGLWGRASGSPAWNSGRTNREFELLRGI